MIGFDVSAVRAILFTVAVYMGIATPPILISQTKQLIYCGFLSSDLSASRQEVGLCRNQQLFPSSSDFSLSLEWTLFNPNHGFCPAKNFPHGLNSTKVDQPFEQPSNNIDEDCLSFQHVNTSSLPEICPLEIIFTLPVCYNTSFVFIYDQPGQSDFEVSLSSNLDSEQPRKNDPIVPQDSGICYNSSLISTNDTPEHSNFEISASSDLHTQPQFSDDDPHFSITLQDSEVCSSIPISGLSPEDLFDETNLSTSLPTGSQGFLNEYQPLPGSDSGFLWYHEQLRAYLRNVILSALPETWTKWITSNRPKLGIICVIVMYGSLLWPLLFVLWKQVKAKRGMIWELSMANRACQIKDAHVSALKRDKKVLTEKLVEANTHSQNMKELVNARTQELLHVNQDKTLVETKLSNVSDSLSAAQNQISQQLSKFKRLEEETHDRMEVLDSEHSYLLVRVADLTEEKHSLEAENLLVKYAKETTFTSLAALQADHEQTKKGLVAAKEAYSALESQLSVMVEELITKNTKLCEQEKELKELSDCLNQVTSQTAELACLSCESVLDEEVATVCFNECSKDVQISSIQVVLDGFQVEIAQQQYKEEIRQVDEELEKKGSLVKEYEVENRNLKEQVSLLEAMSKINSDQMRELKLKMKGITEYFHSEEANLHRKLVVSERKLQQFELLNSEAQEKRINTEKERKEYKDSKQQLRAVIKTLRNQVQVNMDRADKAMKYTKSTEQELRLANTEIIELKKRLNTEREAGTHNLKCLNRAKPSTESPDCRLPSPPHEPLLKNSLLNRHSPSRSPFVQLTRRANQLRSTFPSTSTKSTPTSCSKHTPNHPSPLLQSVGLSAEGEKKRVSCNVEISTVTGTSCSPSSTAAISVAQSRPGHNPVPQCDMEDGSISKAKEANPKADIECEGEEPGAVIVAPKKSAEQATLIEDTEFSEPARDILLLYSKIIRPWSNSDQYY